MNEQKPDFWKDKTPAERISAVEDLRRQKWPDSYDKPLDRSVWRLVDLHDPNKIYKSSADKS